MCDYFYPNKTFSLFPNQAINTTINLLFVHWLPYILRFDEKVNETIIRYKVCGPLMGLMREFMKKERVK
jgi:hypothetical protein